MVLPQPDSPTRASTSPGAIVKETSSTARTLATGLPRDSAANVEMHLQIARAHERCRVAGCAVLALARRLDHGECSCSQQWTA